MCDPGSGPLPGITRSSSRGFFADRPGIELVDFDLTAGAFPIDLDACDAWITTGSRHSVYEDVPLDGQICRTGSATSIGNGASWSESALEPR